MIIPLARDNTNPEIKGHFTLKKINYPAIFFLISSKTKDSLLDFFTKSLSDTQ
jgi:hypothetical protein